MCDIYKLVVYVVLVDMNGSDKVLVCIMFINVVVIFDNVVVDFVLDVKYCDVVC